MENLEKRQRFVRVSQGSKNKLYTLWFDYIGGFSGKLPLPPVFKYQRILSADKEIALKLAQEIADSMGIEMIDESSDKLLKIRRGNHIIKFGKNKNKSIYEVDDKYLVWIAKGCWVKDEFGHWLQKKFGGEELMELAINLAVEKGLGKIENNYFKTI